MKSTAEFKDKRARLFRAVEPGAFVLVIIILALFLTLRVDATCQEKFGEDSLCYSVPPMPEPEPEPEPEPVELPDALPVTGGGK